MIGPLAVLQFLFFAGNVKAQQRGQDAIRSDEREHYLKRTPSIAKTLRTQTKYKNLNRFRSTRYLRQSSQAPWYEDLNHYFPRFVQIRHREHEKSKNLFCKLSKKQFRANKRRFVRSLNNSCYPRIKIKHKDLARVCLPYTKLHHQSISARCLPRMEIKHKDLQSKCYPTPKVKHKNLSSVCLPRYKVRHRDLNTVCYKPPFQIQHRDLSNKCYESIRIRHKNMNMFSCTELHLKHNDLNKVKIACDPNIRDHITTMERIGKEVKYWFTRHKKFCKLENRYSGMSKGNVVESSVGPAVIEDYLVKKGIYYPTRVIVSIPKSKPRDKKGEPRLKYFKLSKAETKEIMIRELVRRRKFVWLVRMYPDERRNLDNLKSLYLNSRNPNLNGPIPNDPADQNRN